MAVATTFGLSSYLIYCYRQKIKRTCINFVVSLFVKVGTQLYGSQKSAKIEGRHIEIPYYYNGLEYTVYVPYSRRLRRKMLNCGVFIIDGSTRKRISQQPGVPFLITADALGGELIEIEDYEGEQTKTFTKDEIPVI